MTVAAPELPYLPALLREALLADDRFSQLCAGRCGTKAPTDVTRPYAIVQAPGGSPLEASAGVWSPLVQINGWCAPGGPVEPEVAAWRVAARAASVLAVVRNRRYLVESWACDWSATVVDGPLSTWDVSRGEDNPIYGALIRAELTVHVTAV